MINISVSIEIAAPADELFAFVSDVENNSTWQTGVESTTWITEPPISVGSTYRQRTQYRETEITYTVVEFEPGRSITAESEPGATLPSTVTRTVESAGEAASIVTVVLAVRTRGVRRLIQPLVKRVVRNSVESDYRRLKRILEEAS